MQSRRTFIRNLALAIPAYSLCSVLLSSCGKQELPGKKGGLKIGIIGAGVSGLHAAWMLKQQYGYDVEILEASDKVGGRIQSMDDLFGMGKVELGASEIFGQGNIWYDTVKRHSSLKTVSEELSSYFIHGDFVSQSSMSSDSDFQSMEQRLSQICGNSAGSDISVASYMESVQVPQRVQFIFKGKAEQFLGTSVDRASVVGNSEEGLGKLNLDKYSSSLSFEEILRRQYATIYPSIYNNTQVTSIDYTGEKVKVTDAMQVERTYDHLIVTVPLSVLKIKSNQAYGITFKPELPKAKQEAMEMLGMDAGIKIFLKVNYKFWEEGADCVYLSSKIGKFDIIQSDANGNHILAATVHGENADYLNGFSSDEILDLIKNEWKAHISNKAALSIQSHKVVFWGKEKFVQGSFSYHKVGGSTASRHELARPVDGKIYFAGEACNTSNNSGTIHGAIETAVLAVKQLSAKLA